MEYKRRIRSALLICAACITAGCFSELNDGHMRYDGETVEIHISYVTGSLDTKAINPDEERITDVSLIIFDENGDAEATELQIGDFMIATNDGVYRVGRDEFMETHVID